MTLETLSVERGMATRSPEVKVKAETKGVVTLELWSKMKGNACHKGNGGPRGMRQLHQKYCVPIDR